jgi:hypothetical protein
MEQQNNLIERNTLVTHEGGSNNELPIKSLKCIYQYGVPMTEDLLSRLLTFFADTPKSAAF